MLIDIPRLIRADAGACRYLNRANRRVIGGFFAVISRLGDGVFWYLLMAALVLLPGGWRISVLMALTGAAATTIYRSLKQGIRRPRPSEVGCSTLLTVAPLDRFSFPSGHTLHAVCFTIIACHAVPALGWLLVPFTILVALSRMILGLHYPSDVLVGAAIGASMATLGILTANVLGVVL